MSEPEETAERGRLYGFGDGFAEYVEQRLEDFHDGVRMANRVAEFDVPVGTDEAF